MHNAASWMQNFHHDVETTYLQHGFSINMNLLCVCVFISMAIRNVNEQNSRLKYNKPALHDNHLEDKLSCRKIIINEKLEKTRSTHFL